MSRLLYQLSYTATTIEFPAEAGNPLIRAPMRNRTADLLLTMETLYRLSYRGERGRQYLVTAPNTKSRRARPRAARPERC